MFHVVGVMKDRCRTEMTARAPYTLATAPSNGGRPGQMSALDHQAQSNAVASGKRSALS
jgi:hypothetical protein